VRSFTGSKPQDVLEAIASDGCFDRSQFFHDVSLYDMNTKGATVVTLAELPDDLRGFPRKAAA
jgi:hypothetical protein